MDLNPITGVIKAANGIIGRFKASPEEKAAAAQAMFEAQVEAERQQIEREKHLVGEQSKIIRAEIGSGSWLAGNWRPLCMLLLVGCVVCHWLGIGATDLPPEVVLSLLNLVKIGVGGYVVGRTVEKVAGKAVDGKGLTDAVRTIARGAKG